MFALTKSELANNHRGRPAGVSSAGAAVRISVRNILILLAASILVMLPVIIVGFPKGADLPNHLQFATSFYDALRAGNIHPGWLAESNFGLGDPRFVFYPPALYYLFAGTRFLTGAWYPAFVVSFVALTFAGGLGAYWWARTAFDQRLALGGAILFIIAPYHLNEFYQASLLAEYAACAVLPFLFAFVERICRRQSRVDLLGLAAAYALLLLTHLPLAVIGSIAITIYALVRIERPNFWRTIARLSGAALLGLAASSYFWWPMLAELSWIKGSEHDPKPYFDYRLNFVFSPSALTNRNTWYANVMALAVVAFFLPGLILVLRSFRKTGANRMLRATFIVLCVTFLMSTSLSRPVWAMVPKLSEVQFPWRWFAITSLMGALMVAASVPAWLDCMRARLQARHLLVISVFVLSLVFTGIEVVQDSEYLSPSAFTALTQEAPVAVSVKDWMPIWSGDYVRAYNARTQATDASRTVSVTAWNPEHRTFAITAGAPTELLVRTFFYPRWIASANGQVLPVNPTPEGLLKISVPAGATSVDLSFQKPARVRVAELISIAAWMLIFCGGAWTAISTVSEARPLGRASLVAGPP